MGEPAVDLRGLYRARAGRVDYVDVPELTYLVLSGAGAPESDEFAEASEALFAVSATIHFVAKRRTGAAHRRMPLEALWWSADAARVELLAAVALAVADVRQSDRRSWRWQAMIAVASTVDDAAFDQAVVLAGKRQVPRVDEVRKVTWREGPAAQVQHTGSYASAARAVTELHDAIERGGHRAMGRHHEIYLTDPRRTERDAMRMLLRRPVVAIEETGDRSA
jgi:hypothetical protein